jgi:hypothetical protein
MLREALQIKLPEDPEMIAKVEAMKIEVVDTDDKTTQPKPRTKGRHRPVKELGPPAKIPTTSRFDILGGLDEDA